MQFLLNSAHIWKSYSKKQRGRDFLEHGVHGSLEFETDQSKVRSPHLIR